MTQGDFLQNWTLVISARESASLAFEWVAQIPAQKSAIKTITQGDVP